MFGRAVSMSVYGHVWCSTSLWPIPHATNSTLSIAIFAISKLWLH